MTNAFTERSEFLIGMHFELPKHPLEGSRPYACYWPANNFIGAQIVANWINREMERVGLITLPGAIWGELNCCSGRWLVTNIGEGLEVIERVIKTFYPGGKECWDAGWFCTAESVWRMWRPVDPSKDFGRHFTPEAVAAGQRQMNAVAEMMSQELKRLTL